MAICVAAETTDSGDRDDRKGAYERRGIDDDHRHHDGSGSAERPRGRSYSYKEHYGDGKPPSEGHGRSYSYKERYGDRGAARDGRGEPDYGQKLRETDHRFRRKSDFKYDADAASDSHLSHRSYRGRGSPYGSGRDRRTFGKDPKDKRRSRR